MRISDWSSDVCSSDLARRRDGASARLLPVGDALDASVGAGARAGRRRCRCPVRCRGEGGVRSFGVAADDGCAGGGPVTAAVWIQLGASVVAVVFLAWRGGKWGLGADPRLRSEGGRVGRGGGGAGR